jgi:hypothetical protein
MKAWISSGGTARRPDERAWVVLVDGEVEVASAGGERVPGGSGLLVEFAPAERHEVVRARTRGFCCC